jgi:hypothetical protein
VTKVGTAKSDSVVMLLGIVVCTLQSWESCRVVYQTGTLKLKFTFRRPPKLCVASQCHAGIHWMVPELKRADGRMDVTTYTLGCNLMHFMKITQKLINVFESYKMYYSK